MTLIKKPWNDFESHEREPVWIASRLMNIRRPRKNAGHMKALGWYWYTHELAANTVGITFIGEKKKTYKMLHYDERLSREGHYTAYEFGFNLLIEGNLDYQRGRIWWPIVKQMDEAYQRRPRKQITKHSTRMVMNRIGYDFH